MPNNILITPGSASIQFSGSAANTIRLVVEPSGSIAFYGNSGSLFGITDSLSGSLMNVNDISGLPILEVFSDDRVVMGTFNRNTLVVTGSRVGIRTNSPTAELDVSGSVLITGSLGVSAGITGSLFGTSSFATTASYALASAGGGGAAFPFTGSAVITGSLLVSGSGVIITGSLQTDRYSLGLSSLGNASGSMSINLNNGNYFIATTSASTNWSITNTPSNRAVGFVLALTSGGAQPQTWPSAVKWPNGVAPTLTAAGQDTLTFITDNGGTAWRGVLSIKDSR